MADTATAGSKNEARASRPFVNVFCKVSVAWMDLRIFEPVEVHENTQTGPRKVTEWRATGEMIRIRGTAYPRGEPPEGYPEKPRMVMGYAVTEGVRRDLYEAWRAQNEKSPLVKNRMVVAFEKIEEGTAFAKEVTDERSGLEPIQRNKKQLDDPRIPKSSNGAVSNLQVGERV